MTRPCMLWRSDMFNRLATRGILGAAIGATVLFGCSEPIDPFFAETVGKEPPSLSGPDVKWLNGEPQDWPNLKGKVVFLQFSFLE